MNAKEQIEKNTTEYDEARLEEALDILMQMRAVDKTKGYRRIMASVNRGTCRRRFILWSRYAAIVVVIVVVGVIWGVRGRVDRVVPVMQVQEIVPGGMKARLILATGENVVLDTLTLETASIWEAGATIRKNGGVLTYENARKEEVRPMEVMYNTLEVPRGGEYDLVLEDGTRVWLNADSRLKYPVVFPGSERRVMLEGEAYFDVVKDSAHPFVVKTSMGDIKVLGTAFNVSVYDERMIAATLEKGSICYLKDTRKGVLIKPGEQLISTEGSDLPVVRKVNTRLYTAWKDNLFCFEEQHLDQIMSTLARWYDFQVKFESEELKKLELSGTLDKYSDIQPLLRLFELGTDVKFEIQNKVIYVRRNVK